MRYIDDKQLDDVAERSFVRIHADAHTVITRHADPDEKWDNDSTDTTTNVQGIEFVGEKDYFDLVVPFAPQNGETYYLVYVNYDTGDSFGTYGGQICYLDLFKSKELADKLAKKIEEDTKVPFEFSLGKKAKKEPNTVKYFWDNGKQVSCYTGSWKGYFERFNYVAVESVSVRYSRKYRRS